MDALTEWILEDFDATIDNFPAALCRQMISPELASLMQWIDLPATFIHLLVKSYKKKFYVSAVPFEDDQHFDHLFDKCKDAYCAYYKVAQGLRRAPKNMAENNDGSCQDPCTSGKKFGSCVLVMLKLTTPIYVSAGTSRKRCCASADVGIGPKKSRPDDNQDLP